MAYVAVKGGKRAIEESIERIKYERLAKERSINVDDIDASLRLLVDLVMSEGALYSPYMASIAIKQAEGSLEEAVFLIRAYRSTLPRKYYSSVVESSSMDVERRISSAFKDIPGGQILGTCFDYTHRLLNFELANESNAEVKEFVESFLNKMEKDSNENSKLTLIKVTDYLRSVGLMKTVPNDNTEPVDATKNTLNFPVPRSQQLQILTRGMTQAVIALGYASMRGYGSIHPTVGELRVGKLPISIKNPLNENDDDEYYIGEIKVTEVESLVPNTVVNSDGKKEIEFEIGYGIAIGQNETKAIAMSILERCLQLKDKSAAVNDEEFVLYHIDSVESTGFTSHLKLPHYVTFQSKLNSIRKIKKGNNENGEI